MSQGAPRRSPLSAQALLLIAFFVIAGVGIATVLVPALSHDAEDAATEGEGGALSDAAPTEPEE